MFAMQLASLLSPEKCSFIKNVFEPILWLRDSIQQNLESFAFSVNGTTRNASTLHFLYLISPIQTGYEDPLFRIRNRLKG